MQIINWIFFFLYSGRFAIPAIPATQKMATVNPIRSIKRVTKKPDTWKEFTIIAGSSILMDNFLLLALLENSNLLKIYTKCFQSSLSLGDPMLESQLCLIV